MGVGFNVFWESRFLVPSRHAYYSFYMVSPEEAGYEKVATQTIRSEFYAADEANLLEEEGFFSFIFSYNQALHVEKLWKSMVDERKI